MLSFWKLAEEHKDQSIFGNINLYSDKLHTLHLASSYGVYSFHVTALYFTENIRSKQTVFGFTIVAYRPVNYFERNKGARRRNSTLLNIYSLQTCINYLMKPFPDSEMEGPICFTTNDRSLLLHQIVSSYAANIPESEDVFSFKEEDRIGMQCNMYKAKRFTFKTFEWLC